MLDQSGTWAAEVDEHIPGVTAEAAKAEFQLEDLIPLPQEQVSPSLIFFLSSQIKKAYFRRIPGF